MKPRTSLLLSESFLNAFCIFPTVPWIEVAELEDSSASFLTSSDTTANPLPCSPALAASIAAFKASKFVCSAISDIAQPF